MTCQAVHAGSDYFEREADLVVAHRLRRTSRDGYIRLHVHSQVAHIARCRAHSLPEGTSGSPRAALAVPASPLGD